MSIFDSIKFRFGKKHSNFKSASMHILYRISCQDEDRAGIHDRNGCKYHRKKFFSLAFFFLFIIKHSILKKIACNPSSKA